MIDSTRFDGERCRQGARYFFSAILFVGTTGVGNTSPARIEAMRLVTRGQNSPFKHISLSSDVSRRPKEVAHDISAVCFRVFFSPQHVETASVDESTPPTRFIAVNTRHSYTLNRRAIDSAPFDGREGAADRRFVAKTVGGGRGVIDISAHTPRRPGDT